MGASGTTFFKGTCNTLGLKEGEDIKERERDGAIIRSRISLVRQGGKSEFS